MQKLNKKQISRIDELINSNEVNDWDKTLLNRIKSNLPKNVSIAENTLLVQIFKKY